MCHHLAKNERTRTICYRAAEDNFQANWNAPSLNNIKQAWEIALSCLL
jgi:hypothetical protein